jgi:two-component system invasion response regulator UvrY
MKSSLPHPRAVVPCAIMTPRPIHILCVDDNELVCGALERKFAGDDDFVWCGSLPDATDLLAKVADCNAHVVLLDLDMPGPDPLAEAGKLIRAMLQCRVVVLSGRYSETLVERALAIGAAGYLSKAEASSEIIEAVHKAAAGEVVLGHEVRIAFGLRTSVR